MMKTAILIDGGFFVRRYQAIKARVAPDEEVTAETLARDISASAFRWIRRANPHGYRQRELYRIFFYDCAPERYNAGPHPITGEIVRVEDTIDFAFREALHEQLRRQRKVALRLGELHVKNGDWTLSREAVRRLRAGATLDDLEPSSIFYKVKQAGVDMRIGLDIASISQQGQVDQIILVAGDSDFVPAAKMARRNGIDFILDPMWNPIRPELNEHIDGICSVMPNPHGEAGRRRG
ncbi:NYN domain-containing protein [Modicisalibacter sp. 'Wilcox']|uniref:NYN domain-containing protein n=1 Tax=Modicisalibacter sp. 'Wilcox' TaxID=2679914 RepID=UPI0013D0F755|nr:NYN domain-containing protein [Modicisalibacter sp. 'Wilcox']